MLRHPCATEIGHADPCTRALLPQRAGYGPGPEASVRPTRPARAKPVCYVDEPQVGPHFEALPTLATRAKTTDNCATRVAPLALEGHWRFIS